MIDVLRLNVYDKMHSSNIRLNSHHGPKVVYEAEDSGQIDVYNTICPA